MWEYKKEFVTYIILIIGWILFTWGLYDIFGLWIVKLSGGIFLIGMSTGFRGLLVHLIEGLYSLTEE